MQKFAAVLAALLIPLSVGATEQLQALQPRNVLVSVKQNGWIETLSICNISGSPIPLTNLELNFTYASPAPYSFWGVPWLNWKYVSTINGRMKLVGGSQVAAPLPFDPECKNPMTVIFNADPAYPQPTAPFVLLAEGASPVVGNLTITLPAVPLTGLVAPTVAVTGPGFSQSNQVAWGAKLQLTSLAAGSYTVSGSSVENGAQFFRSLPVVTNVTGGTTAAVLLDYKSVPTSQVKFTLINSPQIEQPITLIGKIWSFVNKTISNNSTLTLPADTYTVTSLSPGVAAMAIPSQFTVPGTTAVTIHYQAPLHPRFVGYFESWSESSTTDDASKIKLANLPSYLNVVNLAFMRPDAVYQKGSFAIDGTGLQFNYPSHTVLKFAVSWLHRAHPQTKILVSLGGNRYGNWNLLNPQAIADFVADYGLDGVDVNYQPLNALCAKGANGLIQCQVDKEFQAIIQNLRATLPRPYWLTVTTYGNAAYGEGQWETAQPVNGNSGLILPLLRSPVASEIDMVNIMGYDLGTSFDPATALAAFSFSYRGPLSMGVSVSPQQNPTANTDLCQVLQLTQLAKTSAASRNTAPGMMLWSVQKKNSLIVPSVLYPSAQMMATTVCLSLGLYDCHVPLLPLMSKENNSVSFRNRIRLDALQCGM